MFIPDKFPRMALRRRLLVALLAVAMAAFLTWSVTRKSGVVRHAAQHAADFPADVPACAAGQTQGCVGSKTQIITSPQVEEVARASSAAKR